MKRILNLLIIVFCSTVAIAQPQPQDVTYQSNTAFSSNTFSSDFPFGVLNIPELERPASDASVHALMLNEYGKAFFVSNTANPPIQFEYHARIKIFDEAGLKKGVVEIPLYNRDRASYEKIREVTGKTFYKTADGAVKSIQLTDAQVKTTRLDDHHSVVTFTLPELTKGCIIEYKYILESPYIVNFRTWEFQSDIPKLTSVYNVIIPQFFGYEVTMKGNLKLNATKSQIDKKCYYFNGLATDCINTVYAITDIPALATVPGVISLKDYRSAIYFQLTDMISVPNFTDRNYGVSVSIGKNWEKFDEYLMMHDDLGQQLKGKSPFKSAIKNIIAGKATDLDKAKAVYQYIQHVFKWNGYYGIFSPDGIKKSFDRHSGNVADINLALISALNAAGIKAEAVITSTRENGAINTELPSLNDFNYIVAKVYIDGKVYMADATDPAFEFGVLPPRVVHDKGRNIRFGNVGNWE
ncbi:MAG: DUF3857 domain-containing protein [Mucilaginibacter sp.]